MVRTLLIGTTILVSCVAPPVGEEGDETRALMDSGMGEGSDSSGPTGDSGGSDAGEDHTGDPDTGDLDAGDDTEPEPCLAPTGQGRADGLTLFENAWGSHYVMVELPSEHVDPLAVMVVFPSDGQAAYERGAPVSLVLPPTLARNDRWRSNPSGYFRPEHGIVEVQPVLPGWRVRGFETGSAEDHGGPLSVQVLAETARFVLGELQTTDGHSLEDLVSQTVCTDSIALMANSSGGLPAGTFLAEYAETMGPRLLGFAGYENPVISSFAMLDLGGTRADPDKKDDGDGNGVPWDDARNRTLGPGGCDESGCELDWSRLRWDGEATPEDAFPTGAAAWTQAGLFYLDGDGDGALSLDPDNGLDVDGDGVIAADEDFVFMPHERGLDDEVRIGFSRPLLEAARDLGVFDDSGWPENLMTADEAVEFWGVRNQATSAAVAAEHLPADFGVVQAYTEVPHGSAATNRPEVVLLHDAWLAEGFAARANPSREVLQCASQEPAAAEALGGPEPGAPLLASEIASRAIPEDILVTDVRAASVLQLFADAWGPVEHCFGDLVDEEDGESEDGS